MDVVLLPDTNLLLHYQRLDQIDWCSELKVKRVQVFIAHPVIHELDEKKFSAPTSKLRHRAQALISWLWETSLQEVKQIRPGVELVVPDTELSVDFEAHGLNPISGDDRLIAAVLALDSAQGRVVVGTADLGLRLKLRSRGIQHFCPHETYRLQDEKSPEEKENERLKRELATHQNRLPALSVELNGSSKQAALKPLGGDVAAPDSLTDIQEQYPKLRQQGPDEETVEAPNGRRFSLPRYSFLQVHPRDVEAYNEKLDAFFADYAKFTETHRAWLQVQRSISPLLLRLQNTGSLPASQIDVTLTAPNGALFIELDELPEEPEAPAPPSRPEPGLHSLFAQQQSHDFKPFYVRDFDPLDIAPQPVTVEIHEGGRRVEFSIENLRHGKEVELEGIGLQVKKSVKLPFQLHVKIGAAELIQSVETSFLITAFLDESQPST